MTLPVMTPEQRAEALEKAARVRTARAVLKTRLKSGEVTLADALADEEVAGRMKVSQLIEAMPGLGKIRAAGVMERLGIDPGRRVRGLGPRQREALEAEFTA